MLQNVVLVLVMFVLVQEWSTSSINATECWTSTSDATECSTNTSNVIDCSIGTKYRLYS